MAVVACLFFLLPSNVTPFALSLATGRQDEGAADAEKATSKGLLYDDRRNKTPLLARLTGIRGTSERDGVLVKRTSSRSSSHRRWSPHLQDNGLQQVLPNHLHTVVPPAQGVLGGDRAGLSTATTSYIPADGPFAPHTEGESSSKQPDKAALHAEPNQESTVRTTVGDLAGQHSPKKRVFKTSEKTRAARRERNKRWKEGLTPERMVEFNERHVANAQRFQQRQRARRMGLPGPPLQRTYRDARRWKKQVGAQGVRQPASAETRMEEATQRAVDVTHAPSGTPQQAMLRLRTFESSSGSRSRPAFPFRGAIDGHRFAPAPSSLPLDLDLSLSAPGSSSSGQRQTTDAPRPAALPPARTLEEQRLRLTLAPPGQHDRPRLTLAPPKHE